MARTCSQTDCPYNGERIIVPFEGGKTTDILVVGESPGHVEERVGKPFRGKSGDVLNAMIKSIGLDRSDVFIANATRCRIDKDTDGVRIQNAAMRECRFFLDAAIKLIKPKLIVSLGAIALKQLTGKQKILSNRGRVFESEWGVPILCTVHPAYILRGAQKKFPQIPISKMTQKERMIFEDFSRVTEILQGETQGVDYDSYTQGNYADWKTFAKSQMFAFDYETTGLDPFAPDFRILSVALSTPEGFTKTFLLRNGQLPPAFKKLLQNKRIQKVVAARGFEEKVTRVAGGVTIEGPVHDVLMMGHLVDENGAHDLQTLAGVYTPLRAIKDIVGGDRTNLAEVPKETLVQYNGVDADATMRLYTTLGKTIGKDPKLPIYYSKFVVPAQKMFAECFQHGCLINKRTLRASEAALTAQIGELEAECLELIPEPIQRKYADDLNLSRRALIIDLLFKHRAGYRLRPDPNYRTAKTGEPKTSKDHLQLFPDNEFIQSFLELGKCKKALTTYLTKLWTQIKHDGRVYPETLMTRTVTGRTVALNPHIQIIPTRGELSHLIRRCFVPDPYWQMGTRDLGQSEIRIAGWLANDPTILNALKNDIDIHTMTASVVNGIPVEEVTKDMRQAAKAINFGFLYGMGAPKFQFYAKATYGIDFTLQQCEQIRARFFSKPNGYWRLPIFHETQRAIVKKQGFVRSPLGRKRRLPEVYSQEWSLRGGAERQAINFPIQSFSSDLGIIAQFLFHEAVKANEYELRNKAKAMWFIHDATYFQAKRTHMKRAMKLMKECMEERAPEYIKKHWGVELGYPVTSDGKIGSTWADMKEVP